MRIQAISLIFASLLLAGCQSGGPNYELVVFNQGSGDIEQVEVEFEGHVVSKIAQINPRQSSSHSMSSGSGMPDSYRIRWTDHEGKRHEQELTHDAPFPRPFKGELYFQVGEDGTAKLFKYGNYRRGNPHQPWSQQKEWEGQPRIPGIRSLNEPEL